MSSTLLYLAIVAVWAVVLVPMYLRRDTDANGISRLLSRRPGMPEPDEDDAMPGETTIAEGDSRAYESAGHDGHDTSSGYAEHLDGELEDQPRRRMRRATVIARRRRQTFMLFVTVLATIAMAATGVAPWWITLPPTTLFVGHLVLLRVAAGMDAMRRRQMIEAQARARARAAEQARRAKEAAKAEIIDLAERAKERDVFDQYADGDDGDVVRAVGD